MPPVSHTSTTIRLLLHLAVSINPPHQAILTFLRQARPARAVRSVTNENDENVGTTRVTRAKAAALEKDDVVAVGKALQPKKAGLNANPQPRKRAALGDVSNVTKGDAVVDGSKKNGKTGLVSKASYPTGVTKNVARVNATRQPLGSKDSKPTAERNLKRTASASGSGISGAQKKRVLGAGTSNLSKESTPEDVEPLKKKAHKIEVETVLKTEEVVEKDIKLVSTKITKEEVASIPEWKDLDADDIDDPLMVSEYVGEIFAYLGELEIATKPNANYMEMQEDLEWKMRGILVDWLIEVHTRFHLLPETLFLAVNIIDRFLSNKVVQLDRLQLVGVTAMFIASKYEEVLSPHVGNFRHVADDGFTEAEILSAERFILQALNYDLSYPNPMNFLRRISKADDYDIQTRTLGKYLMEISLLDHRFMEYLPSHIAAASMYLARLVLDRGEWVSY